MVHGKNLNCFISFNFFFLRVISLSTIQMSIVSSKSTFAVAYENIVSHDIKLNQGWIRKSPQRIDVMVKRSIRDLDDNVSRLYVDTYNTLFDSINGIHSPVLSSFEVSRSIITDISPTGRRTISARLGKDESPVIEISGCGGITGFRVDASKVHGKFVGDGWFGGCSWSPDERYVAYVASIKEEKRLSYFSDEGDVSKRGNQFEIVEDWGEKYTGVSSTVICVIDTTTGDVTTLRQPNQLEDWTVGQPTWAAINENGKYVLAYTAWPAVKGRRLGMIYCYQRPCSVFRVDLSERLSGLAGEACEAHECLTDGVEIARSPRFAPDGESILFLGSRNGASTHNLCSQLFRVRPGAPPETLVDVVGRPAVPGGFPGLYVDALPRRCFLVDNGDGGGVLLESVANAKDALLVYSFKTRRLGRLSCLDRILASPLEQSSNGECSVSVLDVQPATEADGGDVCVLFSLSTPATPARLGAFRIPVQTLLEAADAPQATGSDIISTLEIPLDRLSSAAPPAAFQIAARKLAGPASPQSPEETSTPSLMEPDSGSGCHTVSSVQKSLRGLPEVRWRIIPHTFKGEADPRRPEDADCYLESILLTPHDYEGTDALPLIVVPHGGPHSCFTTAFMAGYVFLASSLRAAVLLVNFRGSTGFGQTVVDSLPGHIGRRDVDDVIAAAEEVLSGRVSGVVADRRKVSVVGGSHGGFLAAHLIGQRPDMFRSAAMRNPVIDLTAMAATSDIPDWCASETRSTAEGHSETAAFDHTQLLNAEAVQRLWAASPVAHVSKVITPTLLCIGGKDRRVPPSQGLHYHQLLKSRGVPTKLLLFPDDSHSLDGVKTEAEQWVAIASWISRFNAD